LALQEMFVRYGYEEAIIFGHALEGNLHFVFTQAFEEESEVKRYEAFMEEVAQQVSVTYGGSLKAEHGTGRNMAPFVALEWGEDAYDLMWKIKEIFDPKGILNPDIILNRDHSVHLKHFKTMPAADPLIDTCIECGFCEPKCPSNYLTLTPRQRIVAFRQLTALERAGEKETYEALKEQYQYDGIETCATCQLCSLSCPIGIDTGSLTKKLRAEQVSGVAGRIAWQIVDHYSAVLKGGSVALRAVYAVSAALPHSALYAASSGMRAVTGERLPQWSASMPTGEKFAPHPKQKNAQEKVVYFSSCINRTMSNPRPTEGEPPLYEVVIGLLERAGYEVIIPEGIEGLCCGMPFSSKGYMVQGHFYQPQMYLRLLIQETPILC